MTRVFLGQKFIPNRHEDWGILFDINVNIKFKDYIEKHSKQLSDNYKKWIYSNCTNAVYRIVFDRSAKKLRDDWMCRDPREDMNYRELNLVERVEETAMALIDIKEYEPLTAVKETEQRLLIKKIKTHTVDRLLQKSDRQ